MVWGAKVVGEDGKPLVRSYHGTGGYSDPVNIGGSRLYSAPMRLPRDFRT
jgi:hypothetical protein